MPHIVLAVSENRITCNLSHPTKGQSADNKVEGYAVCMAKKDDSGGQQWSFNADGQISSQVQTDT